MFFQKKKNERTTGDEHAAAHRDASDIVFLCGGTDLPVQRMTAIGINEPNLASSEYKRTGGEALLRFGAFHIVKNCPVEILHTVTLGETKYRVTELCQFVDKTESAQLDKYLRSYSSKVFISTMRGSLRLHKSFVGRDYKVLAQQLPIVLTRLLRNEWSTVTSKIVRISSNFGFPKGYLKSSLINVTWF